MATPDPEWWRVVFTETEYNLLENRLATVAEEFADESEPIAVVVPVAPSDFHELFHQVMLDVMDGQEHLMMFGYALAHEYMNNDDIEANAESSTAYHYFAEGVEPDDD